MKIPKTTKKIKEAIKIHKLTFKDIKIKFQEHYLKNINLQFYYPDIKITTDNELQQFQN